MPETSTGGEGGRANNPAPRVPPGYMRIDGPIGNQLMLTDSDRTIVEIVGQVRAEYRLTEDRSTITYDCESGRSWTIPYNTRPGDTIPVGGITCAMGPVNRGGPPPIFRGGPVATQVVRVFEREYAAGDFVFDETPPTIGRIGGDFPFQAGCPCAMCQENRARYGSRLVAQQPQYRETPQELNTRQRVARQQQEYWDAQNALRERENQELRRKSDEANVRAEETLRMVLRPDELKHYEETNRIVVTGSDGRRYRITEGLIGNVWLLDGDNEEEPLASLCCHPDLYPHRGLGQVSRNDQLPYKDAHIAQILYLRHDLKAFWETANIQWASDVTRLEYNGDPAAWTADAAVAVVQAIRANWARRR